SLVGAPPTRPARRARRASPRRPARSPTTHPSRAPPCRRDCPSHLSTAVPSSSPCPFDSAYGRRVERLNDGFQRFVDFGIGIVLPSASSQSWFQSSRPCRQSST